MRKGMQLGQTPGVNVIKLFLLGSLMIPTEKQEHLLLSSIGRLVESQMVNYTRKALPGNNILVCMPATSVTK